MVYFSRGGVCILYAWTRVLVCVLRDDLSLCVVSFPVSGKFHGLCFGLASQGALKSQASGAGLVN